MNVLLSAVGRRAYLVEYFKQVVHPLGGRVFAVNTHSDATGFMAADDAAVVPASADPTYIDALIGLCRKWDIKLLFSLHDWDAPVIARARERFLKVGTIPVMASANVLSICLDKYATCKKMMDLGINVPHTVLSLSEALGMPFPLVVKPRWGQGSVGLFKVTNREELEWAYNLSNAAALKFACVCPEIDASQPQVLIQECVNGVEYGCDIVDNLDGEFRAAFVKHKFAMRSGETDAAKTVDFPQIKLFAQVISRWSRHLGCMDSDWIVDQDGVPYLIEVNPRFGGGYPFTHCAGANVPLACVNWALGVDDDCWRRGYKLGIRAFKDISIVARS